MNIDDIRLNQLIEIEYTEDDTTEYLPSRVEEISDNHLYIAVPMRKGQIVPMHINQNIRVCFTTKDNSYAFVTTIVARKKEPIPVLIVNKPEKIIKIQRRAYVRIPASIPVSYKLFPDGQSIEQGSTVDISGGGALLLTRSKLQPGQMLDFEMKLPERDSIICKAKVVRILTFAVKEGDSNKIAVEFQDISENQRDKIFSYIFEKQREWIKKGLLD